MEDEKTLSTFPSHISHLVQRRDNNCGSSINTSAVGTPPTWLVKIRKEIRQVAQQLLSQVYCRGSRRCVMSLGAACTNCDFYIKDEPVFSDEPLIR